MADIEGVARCPGEAARVHHVVADRLHARFRRELRAGWNRRANLAAFVRRLIRDSR